MKTIERFLILLAILNQYPGRWLTIDDLKEMYIQQFDMIAPNRKIFYNYFNTLEVFGYPVEIENKPGLPYQIKYIGGSEQ